MATTTRDDPRADGPGDPANRIRRDYRPSGTYDKATKFGVLRRTATEFSEDNLTDWAAALRGRTGDPARAALRAEETADDLADEGS